MAGPDWHDSFNRFLVALDNEGLYSADGVVRHAREQGLFDDENGLAGGSNAATDAVRLLDAAAQKHFNGRPDGLDRVSLEPGSAWLGIRWKTLANQDCLSDYDRGLVARFLQDEAYQGLFLLNRPGPRRWSWREQARVPQHRQGNGSWFTRSFSLVASAFAVLVLVMVTAPARSDSRRLLMEAAEQGRVEDLRQLLGDLEYHDYRPFIIRLIAQVNQRQGQAEMVLADLDQLQAVFAFSKNAMILCNGLLLQPGDRIAVGSVRGYVSEINRESLVLQTDDGSRGFAYPPAKVFGHVGWRAEQISIYGSTDNLGEVLAAVSQITGRTMDQDLPTGFISGSFACKNYDCFLSAVAPYLGLRIQPDVLHFDPVPYPRCFIGFGDHFSVELEITVSQVLQRFADEMGRKLELTTPKGDQVITYPYLQLSDLLFGLNLHGEITDSGIFIVGENP